LPQPPDNFPHPFTLALDDADSPSGGCTTHLTALLLEELTDRILLADYPLLVRLYPGVPRKTRGNAALVIRGYSRDPPERLLDHAYGLARDYRPRGPPGKEPGAALYPGTAPWRVPGLRGLYKRALQEYVPRRIALDRARKHRVLVAGGSGAVGAVAALAALAPWDEYTYELIAYRDGRERRLRWDPQLEAGVPACAWGNYDLYTGRLAAAPGGPDPVLAGFRGSAPSCLAHYAGVPAEPPSLWAIYRSNQHTGGHTRHWRPAPYRGVRVRVRAGREPRRLPGGHLVLSLDDGLAAAFYRETGPLRRAAGMVGRGDELLLEGAVVPRSPGPTLAVDRLRVERVAQEYRELAPRCPRCGRRMKSMGRGKGYRCPACGYRDPGARPLRVWVPRRLLPGVVVPGVSGARHLTRYLWWRPARGLSLPRGPLPVGCFVSRGELPGVVRGVC